MDKPQGVSWGNTTSKERSRKPSWKRMGCHIRNFLAFQGNRQASRKENYDSSTLHTMETKSLFMPNTRCDVPVKGRKPTSTSSTSTSTSSTSTSTLVVVVTYPLRCCFDDAAPQPLLASTTTCGDDTITSMSIAHRFRQNLVQSLKQRTNELGMNRRECVPHPSTLQRSCQVGPTNVERGREEWSHSASLRSRMVSRELHGPRIHELNATLAATAAKAATKAEEEHVATCKRNAHLCVTSKEVDDHGRNIHGRQAECRPCTNCNRSYRCALSHLIDFCSIDCQTAWRLHTQHRLQACRGRFEKISMFG